MQDTDWRWASINERVSPSNTRTSLVQTLIGLVVCVSSVVAMVTLAVLLLLPLPTQPTKAPPLELPDTTTPYNSMSCDSKPISSTAHLPQICKVEFSNGTHINTNHYDLTSCTNCLCTSNSGPCSKGRCCCAEIATTNLTYVCPDYFNGEKIPVTGLATKCGCVPCGNIKASFLVHVLNKTGQPLPLANVTVDLSRTYITDEYGYVGFTVPAAHTKIQLDIHTVCYVKFSHSYFVIPGRVNVLEITLTQLNSISIFPPQVPFLLNSQTLSVTTLSTDITFTDILDVASFLGLPRSDNRNIELFLYFPAKVFPENELVSFVTSGRGLEDEDLAGVDTSFTTLRFIDGDIVPLHAVAMGDLEIVDELGKPLFPELKNGSDFFGVMTVFNNNSMLATSDIYHNLYINNNITGNTFELASSVILQVNGTNNYLQFSSFPLLTETVISPISFIIASQGNRSCFVAVQAYDPLGILQNAKLVTDVLAVSQLHSNFTETHTFVSRSGINSCMVVPCYGDLTVRLLESSGHQLDSIEASLNGPVYLNESSCRENGLGNDSLADVDYIELGLTKRYCDKPHPFSASHMAHTSPLTLGGAEESTQTQQMFCSVRVAIATCLEKAVQVVTVYDFKTQVQVISNSDPDYIATDFEDGSGGSGGSGQESHGLCDHTHILCIPFLCGRNVSISVRQNDNKDFDITNNNTSQFTEPCPGSSISNTDTELLQNRAETSGSSVFVFVSSGNENGVYSSEDSRQLAEQECGEGNNVGVHFQCSLPYE